MKRFILTVGEKLLTVVVIGGLIYVLLLAVNTYNQLNSIGRGGLGLLFFIGIAVIGTAVVILSVYVIYLIIDIREKLDILVKIKGQKDEPHSV